MKKCILVTFFNSNNIGDILLADAIFNDLKSYQLEVVRCSYEGNFDIKSKISNRKSKNLMNKIMNRVFKILENRLFWFDFSKRIKEVDFLVIGGGNMIMDLSIESNAANYFKKYIDIAKKNNKQILVWSIGIGPFQRNEQRSNTINVLKTCDYVTFRDKNSYELANGSQNTHFYQSIDPVFRLPLLVDREMCDENLVGIGVINPYLFYASSESYKEIFLGYINMVNKFLETGKHVILFSTEKADYDMAHEIRNHFHNGVKVEYINDSTDLVNLYSKISFLVSARMHSLIVAYTQNIPFIGLSWQQKVTSFFEIIKREDSCIDINNISENIDKIFQYSMKYNNESDIYRKKIIEEFSEKYDINFELLNKII